MKSGTWQDESKETNAFTILDKPRSEPVIQFLPFGHTVSQFPGCQRPCEHTLQIQTWDLIGRDRKYKHHGHYGQVQQERGEERGSTNKIVVVHNMQGVLKCLTSCQEKVPGLVSGTNRAWQGSGSLAAADRTRQVQPDTSPPPRIHCRPPFQSPFSHLWLSSQVVPFCFFYFIFFINPLSLIANLAVSLEWCRLLE